MGFLAGPMDPIFFLLALGVEIAIFQHRQLVFPADFIGDFPQLFMVTDFVFELRAVLEGHGIHNKMAVHIVGVQVDGDQHLIPLTPHSSGGFLADGERLLRRDLALTKALNAVVTDHLATQAESPLYGDHFGIGVLRRAVDTSHKHLMVGLVVVLHILQGGVQIFIEIFRQRGFVGVVCIVQRRFQIPIHRPEARNCHVASPLSRQ